VAPKAQIVARAADQQRHFGATTIRGQPSFSSGDATASSLISRQ